VKRLFLDGLGGFIESSVEPGRISRFFAVLANELRARGVTTLYTAETQEVIGPGIQMPVAGISSLLENLIALRYVEHRSRLRRLVSVVKVRDSAFDANLREFSITDRGVSVAGTFASAEEVLSGFAHTSAADRSSQPEET
jgi:circadian clock protein KaiC